MRRICGIVGSLQQKIKDGLMSSVSEMFVFGTRPYVSLTYLLCRKEILIRETVL
jgi:hypothetical protein